MIKYRKLTKDEIAGLAAQIKYADEINLKEIKEFIGKFYPPTAHKVILHYGSEYNDSGYYTRVSDIDVYDVSGVKVETLSNYNEDDYWSGKYDMKIGDETYDESETFSITIFMNQKSLNVPDLYIQEETE